jgi:energy-coupling factor transporter ATP-binding protein EcfA2
MSTPRPRLNFPRLRRIDLASFSIYAQKPDITLSVPEGVLCVAGANGVGKSTFLSAVNYAITGRVPSPRRSYTSANEYFEEGLAFTEEFFEGRIAERDRDAATVSVALQLGHDTFELTRAVFEPGGLRAFRILREGPRGKEVELDGSALTDEERQQQYALRLSAAMGLKSFQQFVFLQHFVLTFDESRNLLFWDPKALDAALFLAFGRDPDQQEQADQYRRQMEREESKARNSKWHALRVKRRLDELLSATGSAKKPKDMTAIEEEFDALHNLGKKAHEAVERAELKVRDSELKFIDASAKLVALRAAYAKAFAEHVGDRSNAARHPLVLEAITSAMRCGVCGTEGEKVRATVERKVGSNTCPLCETPFSPKKRSTNDLKALQFLDEQIEAIQEQLDRVAATRNRAIAVMEQAREQAAAGEEGLRLFEAEHQAVVVWLKGQEALKQGGLTGEISRLEDEMARLSQQSKREYSERTKWRAKLQKLQTALQACYRETEQEFVPVFRRLAERFLGMELDVNVEGRDVHTNLVLELRSSARREYHQLSESQRFFLDIALRMALAHFASHKKATATLYIDTPEGSLDIAYEARAGEMFAEFVKTGHDILMTANVNTSQLLKKLAAACGPKRMLVARMTEWGELSDVQLEEEALFVEAYAQIEAALQGNSSKPAAPRAKATARKARRKEGGRSHGS